MPPAADLYAIDDDDEFDFMPDATLLLPQREAAAVEPAARAGVAIPPPTQLFSPAQRRLEPQPSVTDGDDYVLHGHS